MDFAGIPTRYHRKRLENRLKHEEKYQKFNKRSKLILPATSGGLEKDDGEIVSQSDIIAQSDVGVASKRFDLTLDCGPYAIDFSSNGRYLALGGRKGHVGLIDWMSKTPCFEVNVNEQCHAVKILHQETMMAAAQEKHLYIYDNQGVELHCIKKLNYVRSMEFLPYHFLLATASSRGYVSYLDLTLGEIISDLGSHMGPIYRTSLNPTNAVLMTGHSSGCVAMWTPSEKRYVVKLLCHPSSVSALAVDITGNYLATSGLEKKLKIWDLRNNYEPLSTVDLPINVDSLSYSQTGLLAASSGQSVQILKDVHLGCVTSDPALQKVPIDHGINRKVLGHAYLAYHSPSQVNCIRFCPYEDVLGLGTKNGFSSIICPGAGQANFDAMEENPFASKSYRQEREVRRLIQRIPAELISIESKIGSVRKEDILEQWDRKRTALLGEVPTSNDTIKVKKNRKKGRSKATKVEMRKQTMRYQRRMLDVSNMMKLRANEGIEKLLNEGSKKSSEVENEFISNWKRPTDIIISKKMGHEKRPSKLRKKRLRNALDLLIPNKREIV
ncbi:WD repeat-containing protein 46 [Cichlidogyrus casuarinus]|uniref:WD repeat-containing protein 46 n=1 Tax=Cichlidogyrus casuarinus TaxID=1844966 RepID=A0ABD2Q5M1_9PLAT